MNSKRYIINKQTGGGDINNFIKLLFQTQLTNKLIHWKTNSFALHKATDQFDDVLGQLIDRFMEVYIGSNNPLITKENIQIDNIYIGNIVDNSINVLLTQFKTYLINIQYNLGIENTDLLNIKDEMLAEINKMFYLLTLTV